MAEALLPLETIAQARRELSAWLQALANAPDPARQRPDYVPQISKLLHQVDAAMRSAAPEITASAEWRDEVAVYAETLREIRTILGNFEIALRVRSAQLAGSRARASAVAAWAELARHIG
jgi:hypothetical protein